MEESIVKKILNPGTGGADYENGTKVKFHFRTSYYKDGENVIVDDSKETDAPMELIIGKKFKLEIWESAVKTMRLNEVASFKVDKSLVSQYPFVAKTLRDLKKPKSQRSGHCCGATLHSKGVGYEDLNDLLTNPRDLEFVLDLIEVKGPDQYEKESWQLDSKGKLDMIPTLREDGNKLYGQKQYDKAAEKYSLAIGMLEQLMLKEKPHDSEWDDLNKMKAPILLNYAQCQLIKKEYYSVIEHCTTVLETDPDNVKAHFRRGKAHAAAWNIEEAEKDFRRVAVLDASLQDLVKLHLEDLHAAKKAKTEEEKRLLQGKIFCSPK